MNLKAKKYIRKSLKILAWTIGSIIALFLLIVLLLQIPYVQNKVKDYAVNYLEKKIGTEVQIGRIEIGLPKKVILKDVYFESQQGDTLLAGEKLAVDISLFKLMSNEVEINSIDLQGITAKVNRNKRGTFNFDYIIKAFDSGKPKDTTAAPMKFSMNKVKLQRIRVKYDDDITGNYLTAGITDFETRFKEFDLDKMGFNIPDIKLHGLKVRFKQSMVDEIAQTTQKVAEKASSKPSLSLKLGSIDFANIDVGYDNEGSRLDTGLKLKKLVAEVNEVNLQKQVIDLEKLEINGLKGQLAMGKAERQAADTLPESSTAVQQAQWTFKLGKTDLKDIAFKFDDQNAAPVTKGIDYKHLDITNLNLTAKDLSYTPNAISGDIEKLTVQDKSGVNVQELHTEFLYCARGAELKNLYLKTPNTLLKDHIAVAYPSLQAVQKNINTLQVNANIDGSKIGFKDVLLFAPQLANTNPFKDNPNGTVYLSTNVQGSVGDLDIGKLELRGIGNTVVAASGRIKGLPDIKKTHFDLDIRKLQTSAKDINSFVPTGTIPPTIQIPENIAVKGSFKGTMNNISANLNLDSSYGNAKVKGIFDQTHKGAEKYDALVDIDNFNIGKLIKNDSIGRISIKAKVKGTGLDPNTATAVVKGKVIKAEYNKYTYQNLIVDGKINKGNFDAVASMDDPNLDFQLDASGGFNGKYPKGKVHLNVDIADLEKLNLHAGPLKLRGNIDADIDDANPDNPNGRVAIHHLMFSNNEGQFAMDSIKIVALSTADTTDIHIDSQFLKAKAVGKYKLTQLPYAIKHTIAKYYATGKAQTLEKPENPQQITFSLNVDNDPIINKLVPQITRLEPITIKGNYNSANDSLVVNASIPRVVYGTNTISGVEANIKTTDTAMVYTVRVDGLENTQFQLGKTSLTGDIKDNTVNYRLEIDDQKKKQQYLLAGQMKQVNNNTEISLNPNGLMLNYEEWQIAEGNLIRLMNGSGLYVNNFELSKDNGSIKIQSESESANAPLDVALTDFKIETITNAIQKEESKFKGTINGTAKVSNLNTSPVFESQLDITDFAVAKDTVGNIKINIDNKIANTFTADAAVTGNGNDVTLKGNYNTTASSFDLNLNIGTLNMTSIQALSFGALKESKGNLSGQFNITGSTADPDIIGELKFNDVSFKVTEFNALYKGINDNIRFTSKGIEMDNFKIQDQKNNLLTINGSIATTDYKAFGFNMNINAKNFRAINSKAKDNDFYYGDLYLDANLNVKGTLDNPVVDGDLKINEDTDFTVVMPQQDPRIADREGIVEFVDEDNIEAMQRLKIEETVNKTALEGMDVSVSIEIVKEATLNLIIDKGNGDFLELKGEAHLNGGIDPSGKTTLTGRYEFSEGAYQMSFNFIKKKFDIKSGSYILWTGNPTDATLSLTAIYKTEAPPIDLVSDQITGQSQSNINMYKQKIPVNTLLKINGELLSPELSFDIEIPDGNYDVPTDVINTTETKLEQIRQQPSELNKQVIALLLLNRFIGENPFASEDGGLNAGSIARQSVSKILSQQLNNLASDLIKGIELNFDLESTEDYSTGEQQNRTDLNVDVSKKLFNDRLKITVGSSFGLEGPQQANQQSTNIAGDVSLDYQLTQDGRYLVRAYRTNDYQIALQGQVIETGVSFIITMNYNKFRELFHRTQAEKDMIAREKERKARAKAEREKENAEKEKAQEKKKESDLPPNSTNDEDKNK
ncbi:translocation/assembly module TamB domain-containing protein [Flavobacterium sp. RHBU_3]|uniref:translocation/assembly module TamB domain-containing protein n=1 Tax=Flavobacterium sp. RHBU_3 TaxID=3391184 RepID=UPI0039848B81